MARALTCRSPAKIQYESEFEAATAIAHAERELRAPFHAYRCNNHYHITNSIKTNRSKYRRRTDHGTSWCKFCSLPLHKVSYSKHRDSRRHRKQVRLRQ